jgi:SAM-dependent methyltransferase
VDREHLRALRLAELERAIPTLPAGGRVLEIGAGSGWQAAELARRGFDVAAVDLATSPYARERVFPVVDYDGRRLPFARGSFDAAFSSNVLEHVREVEALQAEIRRVLRPGGIAVHLLPSAAWRAWTTLAHVPHLVRLALGRARGRGRPVRGAVRALPCAGEPGARRGGRWRALLPSRHGERGNVLSETWRFSRASWCALFRRAGWRVERCEPVGLFYTGHALLGPRLPLAARRRASVLLGSACVLYALRPEEDARGDRPDAP